MIRTDRFWLTGGESWKKTLCLGLIAALLVSAPGLCAAEPEDESATNQEESEEKPKGEEPQQPANKESAAPPGDLVQEFQRLPGVPTPTLTDYRPAEWFMELRYAVNDTDIKGNQDRSFLHEGINHVAEYTLRYQQTVLGFRQLEGMGLYRYTDDPRVDPEVNSLQRGYVRLSGPTFEANFGDYLTNYSRFSFNQNTKGLNVWKQLPGTSGLRLEGTAGVFSDRWGSIFRGFEEFVDPRRIPDPRFPTKPYTRLILGGRVEQSFDENSFLAFNYSHGSDMIRSLPRQAELRPLSNHVVGLDTGIRLGRDLNIAGELAFSFTEFDKRIQQDSRSNYAGRFEVSHRWKRLSWRIDYARFLPNFFSLNARQVQDLQDASGRVAVDISQNIVLQASFRFTNDNLPGDPIVVSLPLTNEQVALTNVSRAPDLDGDGILDVLPFIVDANGAKLTTFVRAPEVRLLFRRLPPRAGLQVSLGYRERQFETSNKTSFDLATGRPLFRERITKMPFADLDLSLGSSLFGFSYEYRHNRDTVDRSNSTFTNRFVTSYRGTYFWGDWVVSPNFRFETEPESKQVEPSSLDLALNPFLQTVSGRDQTRSILGSVIVDFPKYFSLEVFYRELNAEILSPLRLNGLRLFGNGGYERPYFRAALTYKIQNSEDRFLRLSFERAVNTFLNPDPTAADVRSFRENVLQLEVVVRWRR